MFAFLGMAAAGPLTGGSTVASATMAGQGDELGAPERLQTLAVAEEAAVAPVREEWGSVEAPEPEPEPVAASALFRAAPAAGAPDPGSAKATAYDMVLARGWDSSQYDCLVSLWNKESGWNVYAQNPSSGAYGIPQALPGSKMATAGADWATSAATQITWGLGYISGRYGTPCGAWGHSQSVGWY